MSEIVPKKSVKLEKRKELQDKLITLKCNWFSIDELSENIDIHRNTLSAIINKWEEYPISLEKINKLNEIILEKFNI